MVPITMATTVGRLPLYIMRNVYFGRSGVEEEEEEEEEFIRTISSQYSGIYKVWHISGQGDSLRLYDKSLAWEPPSLVS